LLDQAPQSITDDHFGELCASLDRARRKRPQNKEERAILRDRLEELATQYRARHSFFKSGETPTEIKKSLKRLQKAATRFMDALDGMDRSLWLNIYMRLDNPPEGFAESVSACALGGADASRIRRHFEGVSAIGNAAKEACEMVLSARSAPTKYKAVSWLVTGGAADSKLGLACLYREATDKRPTTNNSESYAENPLGNRATPFVRFVAAFIKPFTPELCSKGLGDAVHRAMKTPFSNKK